MFTNDCGRVSFILCFSREMEWMLTLHIPFGHKMFATVVTRGLFCLFWGVSWSSRVVHRTLTHSFLVGRGGLLDYSLTIMKDRMIKHHIVYFYSMNRWRSACSWCYQWILQSVQCFHVWQNYCWRVSFPWARNPTAENCFSQVAYTIASKRTISVSDR